jgi:hypothetical protein
MKNIVSNSKLLCLVLIGIIFLSGCIFIKPSQVTLTGTATTVGTGTSPQKITFIDKSTGNTYVAAVTTNSYQITLPNQKTFSVSVTWSALGITGGSCDAGTLNLDSNDATQTHDWSC